MPTVWMLFMHLTFPSLCLNIRKHEYGYRHATVYGLYDMNALFPVSSL